MVTGSVLYTGILLKQITDEWWKVPMSNAICPIGYLRGPQVYMSLGMKMQMLLECLRMILANGNKFEDK